MADGERQYDDLEKRLSAAPVITVATIILEGDAKGGTTPWPRSVSQQVLGQICGPGLFQGGIGHNLPQEAPQAFAQAVIDVDGL